MCEYAEKKLQVPYNTLLSSIPGPIAGCPTFAPALPGFPNTHH